MFKAQIALRNIQAYAEYPVRMQKKIVEVGRYEKYEAKRVVVRQGHPASAFYFILSGSGKGYISVYVSMCTKLWV